MTMAAENGSDAAAQRLGRNFFYGLNGLAMDDRQAIHWLQKCLSPCPHRHMSDSMRNDAQADLKKALLRSGMDESSSQDDDDDEEEED